MALRIRVICVGKLKERFYTDAVNEYIKRLSGYCKPEIVELPEQRIPTERPAQAQIEYALCKEGAAIKRAYGAGDFQPGTAVIALCLEGRELDSQGLAGLISEYVLNGSSRLCFIIGGSYGLHAEIKDKADFRLSLSKMTFPHALARVILLEQLYRAFKINEGGIYHK